MERFETRPEKGIHYFYFLLTTKLHGPTQMLGVLGNIILAGQLPPTDTSTLWKRSKTDGRQLAFSTTLLNGALENKP